MKSIRNQHGIALVTALMFTLITLAIIMGLLYFLTQSIQVSASHKRYKTALQAAYGGAEIAMKEVVPLIYQGATTSAINTEFNLISLNSDPGANGCMKIKLTTPTSQWPSACSQTLNPKTSPDFTFTLQSTGLSASPYTVFTKIVDTVIGNTDISGLQLEGAGVTDSGSIINPQHFPYYFRIQIQAEKSTNATEHSSLDIQYAY